MFISKRVLIAGAVVVLVPIVAVAVWLGAPLLFDTVVEEEFPFAAAAVMPASVDREEAEQVMATMAKVEQSVAEKMSDAMPMKKDAGGSASGTPDAVKVKVGSFKDADSFHKGSGSATIYRGADGTNVLRLEDFRVTNGPGLVVLLVEHGDPESQSDIKGGEYHELSKLKGNVGNQNYMIPDSVDIAKTGSVAIYCKPFHVLFSVAPLGDAS